MNQDLAQFANKVLDRCDSTNDIARDLGDAGYPHGTWVSTRVQEKGRGRLGRKWESLEGNLFLSVIARPESKNHWTWIAMATAIAIAKAIRSKLSAYQIPVEVKWPNDLWIRRKKLGGILCEAVGNKSGSFVVVGLGVNCTYAPEGLDQETVSLTDSAGIKIDADTIREAVLEELREILSELEKQGPDFIRSEYHRLAALPAGTRITWGTGAGTITGLGPSGELEVRNDDGEAQKLYAEDVKVRPV
jgi:BirA family transcriptional regulator, biotin operon repressor / biotin---[acetyl-CoA-carboxylase] ligase